MTKTIEFCGRATAEQVFAALDFVAHAGQNIAIQWRRDAKCRKGVLDVIKKETTGWIRYGLDYSHLGTIRNAIERGERPPVSSLPYGEWKDGFEDRIIVHKGEEQCRFYANSFALAPVVSWFKNGRPVTLDAVKPMLLASEYRREYVITFGGDKVDVILAENADEARAIFVSKTHVDIDDVQAKVVTPVCFNLKPASIMAVHYNE